MIKDVFERRFKSIIPEGEFCQFNPENAKKYGIKWTVINHDSSHDMSIVNQQTKEVQKFGHFKHADYADFVETLLNAYREGDLVWKDDCSCTSQFNDDIKEEEEWKLLEQRLNNN